MRIDQFTKSIFRNWPLKLLSVFLAMMCWYFVMGEEVLELNRRLDVRIIVPDGYSLKEGDRRTKYVTLRGPRVYLGNIVHQREMNAIIRINDVDDKKTRYQLGRSDIVGDLDPRVIVDIIDPLIDLEIGSLITKKVPIKESLKGAPASGSSIQRITITPANVTIKGLQKTVFSKELILTELIDVSGLKSTKSFEVNLRGADSESLELNPSRAKVVLHIGEQQTSKTFRAIPVLVRGAQGSHRLASKAVSIKIKGNPAVLESISASNLSAFVDAAGLAVGKHERRVQVKIPVDTSLAEINPKNVIIDIYGNTKK